MKVLSLSLVMLVLLQSIAGPAFSAGEGNIRTDHRIGLDLSFAGLPAPTGLGLDLRFNAASFLRLSAGTGFYNDWLGPNLGRATYNYLMRPMVYGIMCLVIGAVETVFYVPFSGHYAFPHYFSGLDYTNSQNITSYGGGGDFLIPGFRLSPMAGMHWATYTAKGQPYGLTDGTGSHVYFNAGIDYQGPDGGNFGIGKTFCPSLPSGACGYFLNLGKFF